MAEHPPQTATISRQALAHACCLSFGAALVVWGLAPAIVERVASGQMPRLQTLGLGSGALLVGFTFIGLHRLIRKNVRWALYAAFGLSLALTITTLFAAWSGLKPSAFVLILSAGTTAGTWLALFEARDRATARPE